MSTKHKQTIIDRLTAQFNTNADLLKEHWHQKIESYGLQFVNYYEKNPQEADPYRYKLEQRSYQLRQRIQKLKS